MDTRPPREGIPKDPARLEMMRRHKRLTVSERVTLFERLSREAAWVRTAIRRR